jgi:hypothetical protein
MPRSPSPVRNNGHLFNDTSVDHDLGIIAARANGRVRRPVRKKIAFGWYGGKYSHLDWLLPLLPKCHHFCEPFGGSAAVILNRPPSPVETYNDLDGEVVNFFRVLRENKGALVEAIGLTPFSREEFSIACTPPPRNRFPNWNKLADFSFARGRYGQALLRPHPSVAGQIAKTRVEAA